MIKLNTSILFCFLILIPFLNYAQALPLANCIPDSCPNGYREDNLGCNNGICSVNCTHYQECSDTYSTIFEDSELLSDLNISSYSGAESVDFMITNYTILNTNKCYRFRQTTPTNFVVDSDIDGYTSLSTFDSGIALFWEDQQTQSRWYENQKYYSNGGENDYLFGDGGAVWADSCNDDGDNFNSAGSFNTSNAVYCAPTEKACDDFNSSYCDIGCYNKEIRLTFDLEARLLNGLSCNTFSSFDISGSGASGPEIDYINFGHQTISAYIDQFDAIADDSYVKTCNYWPQCNPADSCCDSNGDFRSSGYICQSAHDAICDTANSGGCDGHANEHRCTGTSSTCPDTNYAIDYDKICDDTVCLAQSCSGYTLQPQRTCEGSICQLNDPYGCLNNLNCLDSNSCKKSASSDSDCKTGYVYDNVTGVCWPGESSNTTAYNLNYDANGNLLSYSGLNYSYNAFNQLANVTDNIGNIIARYSYDSNGIRVKKIEFNGVQNTTTYYLDGFVQIVNSSGVCNESYYYYYDKLIAKKDTGGNIYYYHPDHLGSTSLITDANGNVVADLSYEPFGALMGASNERYTYTGHELDSETDNLYMKARYYNPAVGQFMQPDNVIGDVYNPQDLNKYAYVRNNPYRYTDPNGELPLPLITGTIGGIIGWFVGAASSAYSQYSERGSINLQQVGQASLIGAASGFAAGATFGLAAPFIGQVANIGGAVKAAPLVGIAGGASSVVGGRTAIATNNLLNHQDISSGLTDVKQMSGDFLTGTASSLLTYGLTPTTKIGTASAPYEITPHATSRMIQRGVSEAGIRTTIETGESFSYSQNGNPRTGFYDPQTKLFVSTSDKLITTVITDVNKNYITNVKGR
jgi:RHS repeat-associated protein